MTYRVKWYWLICPGANAIKRQQKYFICPCKNNDLEHPKTLNKKMGFSQWGFFALFSVIDPDLPPDSGPPNRVLLGLFFYPFFCIFLFNCWVFWCDFFYSLFTLFWALFWALFLFFFIHFLSAHAVFSSVNWTQFFEQFKAIFFCD